MFQIQSKYPLDGFLDTRIGGRTENQDSCGCTDTPLGFLCIVCDGMGGLNGGQVASSLAVKSIIESISAADKRIDDPVEIIRKAISKANKTIIDTGLESQDLRGMGTTLTLVLIGERCAYVTHIGDSRVYQLRGEKKAFRTFDDSVVFQMVKAGSISEEEARVSSNSNIITKALGISEELEYDIDELPYDRKDRFILCTDGFWGPLPETEFLRLVGKKDNLSTIMERSFNKIEKTASQEKGGYHDNLTAAIFEVKSYSELRSKMERFYKITTIALAAVACLLCLLMISSKKSHIDQSLFEQQQIAELKQKFIEAEEMSYSANTMADSLAIVAKEATEAAEIAMKNAEEAAASAELAKNESKKDKAAQAEAKKLAESAENAKKNALKQAKNSEVKKKEAEEAAAKAKEAMIRANAKAEELRKELDNRIAEKEKEINKLKADLQEAKKNLDDQMKKNNELSDKIKKLEEENSNLTKESTEGSASMNI